VPLQLMKTFMRECHHDFSLASIRLTFFRSAARGLHVPGELTREPTKHEARKRRASVRPRVGCCEELGRRAAANLALTAKSHGRFRRSYCS
jgi:hypothetical protein